MWLAGYGNGVRARAAASVVDLPLDAGAALVSGMIGPAPH